MSDNEFAKMKAAIDPQTSITVSRDSLQAALNCLYASATDEREPLRYRTWYLGAYEQIRSAMEAAP